MLWDSGETLQLRRSYLLGTLDNMSMLEQSPHLVIDGTFNTAPHSSCPPLHWMENPCCIWILSWEASGDVRESPQRDGFLFPTDPSSCSPCWSITSSRFDQLSLKSGLDYSSLLLVCLQTSSLPPSAGRRTLCRLHGLRISHKKFLKTHMTLPQMTSIARYYKSFWIGTASSLR